MQKTPSVLCVLLVALCSRLPAAVTLHPVAVDAFVVTAHQSSVLHWKAAPPPPGQPVAYGIRDYQDRPVARGQAKCAADGLALEIALGPGFYEVEFPELAQRFGIVSLPPQDRVVDRFFAIDAATSWLVQGDSTRQELVRVLRRCGIPMARERLSWAQIQPAADQWRWDIRGYDRLRKSYASDGVQVLELFHDCPGWVGRVGKYPADLVATSKAWQAIASRWRSTWGAVELWNEPDISFGDFLPADQYVAVAKSAAYGLRASAPEMPLVGGVLAHSNRPYLDTAARSGLLECVDIVSFHTYGRAEQMEGLVSGYRDWLRAFGHEGTPLWITECGRPWKRGPDRPPADQDAASALDITMKGIEARACGIARYFPFVYPYYEENDHNFGMMGREATPLRSMAAYAWCVARLSGKRYLGDLSGCDSAVKRARVFGDDRETVAVLYTGSVKPGANIPFKLPVLRAEGIDGRPLSASDRQSVPVPDGLSYVILNRDALQGLLTTDTPAMRMTHAAAAGTKAVPRLWPVVLRYQFDPATVTPKTEGYHVANRSLSRFPLSVRAFNLSDQPHTITLAVTTSPADRDLARPAEQAVTIPAQGVADVSWTLDLHQAFVQNNLVRLGLQARGQSAGLVLPLSVDWIQSPGEEKKPSGK